jgi:MSHA biogenesis protein MshL
VPLNLPRKRLVAAVAACVMLASGCSVLRRDTLPSADTPPTLPSKQIAIGNSDDSAAQLDIDAEQIGRSPFLFAAMHQPSRERLPNKPIRNLHISEGALYDSLRLMLDGTGIALSFGGGQLQGARYQTTMISNLDGTLPDVMEKLSKALGFFYRLEGGVLYVVQEEQFSLELPPILDDDSLASLTNSLQFLGAKDVYLDRESRLLTLKSNRVRLDALRQYIDHIRETRSMLIYDLSIFQVDLTDGSQTGVQWNKFTHNSLPGGHPLDLSLTGGQSITSAAGNVAGAFGIGLVYNTAKFSLDALLSFLKTQGNVRTVSQPRIAFMAGSKGKLRIGQSTRYVSKVGTNTGTSLSQTTVETSDLQTGLDMSLFGDLHDGTVYTKLSLSLTNLIQFNRFTALGTDLTLPQTADREYRSTVRALPGDTILLGGLIQERDSVAVSGLPLADKAVVLGNKNLEGSKSELVLVLKARVVRFGKKMLPPAPPPGLLPPAPSSVLPPAPDRSAAVPPPAIQAPPAIPAGSAGKQPLPVPAVPPAEKK